MATTITVICPHCNNRMRASSEYIGRQGRCPSCKTLVEIASQGDESLATTYPASDTDVRPAVKPPLSNTDVNTWLAGAIGLASAAAFYLIVWPLQSTPFGELFMDRGFIPPVIVTVTSWGIAILVLKYMQVKRQQSYAELELELIPLVIGLEITPTNVDRFLEHLMRSPSSQRGSILGRRISGALEHFKSRKSVPEVQEYLATQAEIDASAVDSGYTLLRAFIWAVPILGFIGTVIGISGAVSGLSDTLSDGGEIMQGLNGVTEGLSTAFDTTLVALMMAILLLFPTESLRKIEYQMLDRIEAFAGESLLRRMADEDTGIDPEKLPEMVRVTLESAFREHQRWLVQWQAQVAELGQVIGSDFEQAIARIQEQFLRTEADGMKDRQDTARLMGEVFDKLAGVGEAWSRTGEQLSARSEGVVQAAEKVDELLVAMIRQGKEYLDFQTEIWKKQESSDLGAGLLALQDQLRKLTERLSDGRHPAPRESGVISEMALAPEPDSDHPLPRVRADKPDDVFRGEKKEHGP